jgi:hypothetical protein
MEPLRKGDAHSQKPRRSFPERAYETFDIK